MLVKIFLITFGVFLWLVPLMLAKPMAAYIVSRWTGSVADFYFVLFIVHCYVFCVGNGIFFVTR